jgi:ubiquinone/menaquinone biosynthesis C-methylase UbiE
MHLLISPEDAVNGMEGIPFDLTLKIQHKYDQFAHQYDLCAVFKECLYLRRLRRELVRPAKGKILEVAVGTGLNFPFYHNSLKSGSIVAIDLSKEMLRIAERRAKKLNMSVSFSNMDCEDLDLPDQCFDTVISSFALCTYSNPVKALSEMARVCRSDGKLLLLEHGRSSYEWLGKRQDRKAKNNYQYLYCNLNREPLKLLEQIKITILKRRYFSFKTIYLVEAKPSSP